MKDNCELSSTCHLLEGSLAFSGVLILSIFQQGSWGQGSSWSITDNCVLPRRNSSVSEKTGRLPLVVLEDLCCPQMLTSSVALLCRKEPLYLHHPNLERSLLMAILEHFTPLVLEITFASQWRSFGTLWDQIRAWNGQCNKVCQLSPANLADKKLLSIKLYAHALSFILEGLIKGADTYQGLRIKLSAFLGLT